MRLRAALQCNCMRTDQVIFPGIEIEWVPFSNCKSFIFLYVGYFFCVYGLGDVPAIAIPSTYPSAIYPFVLCQLLYRVPFRY